MVGVVVIGFSCGSYLLDAIQSVRLQHDVNWRCAVIFDPTEHGGQIGEAARNDTRLTFIESAPLNVCAARNMGYAEVEGELLFSLDGDDVIAPPYIGTLRQLMNDQHAAIAYTGTQYFGDAEGLKHEYPYSPRLLAVRNTIVSSAMIRRKDFVAVGGYDERFVIGFEDWDLWISILKRGGQVRFDPSPHFFYRQRPGSRSRTIGYAAEVQLKERLFHKHRDFCWHSQK